MSKLKVRKIGNSLGLILPKEMTSHLGVAEGDDVSYNVTPQGVELTGYDPDFEKKLEAARRVTRRYRNALKELAK
jgi:putative addiction module antidote